MACNAQSRRRRRRQKKTPKKADENAEQRDSERKRAGKTKPCIGTQTITETGRGKTEETKTTIATKAIIV